MKDQHDTQTKPLPIGEPTLPFLRTEHNYNRNAASDASGINCKDPSLAQQHMKDECDINTIVERFNITGELPKDIPMPQSAHFEEVFDFQSAMNAIIQARHSFERMPAKVRSRFNNDPQKFVEFCDQPENKEEAQLLGLIDRDPPPPLTGAPGQNQPPEPPKKEEKKADTKGVS